MTWRIFELIPSPGGGKDEEMVPPSFASACVAKAVADPAVTLRTDHAEQQRGAKGELVCKSICKAKNYPHGEMGRQWVGARLSAGARRAS